MKKTILHATVLILAWGLAGCGEDSSDPKKTPPPLKEGTWQVVRTPLESEGGTFCLLETDEEGDTRFEYISENCEVGDFTDDSFPCSYEFRGGQLSVQCDFNTNFSGCESRLVVNGKGTYTEASYEITYDVALTVNGACGNLEPCTGKVRVQGTWVSPEGNCEDEELEEFSLSPVPL